MTLGHVIGLWRYPVKSMAAEALSVADVGDEGIIGDRSFGVIDAATGKLLSAKRYPALLALRPVRRDDGEVLIYEPSGDLTMSDAADANGWLSEYLGLNVRLVRAEPERRRQIEMELDDGQLFEFSTPPGSFFDGTMTVHVLTTASLAAAKRHYPLGDWVWERFRPAVLVAIDESVEHDDAGDPWPEDGWIGSEIDLGGPSGVRLRVGKAMDRCIMVTRAQGALPADKAILQTLARVHESNLGVGCVVSGVGRVSVGDEVALVAT